MDLSADADAQPPASNGEGTNSAPSTADASTRATAPQRVNDLPTAALELAAKLFDLARAGDTGTLQEYLNAGIPPNLTNHQGDTLLMLAAYHGRPDTVRALLDKRADPNVINGRGQSPLAGAVFKGHGEVVKALVEGGGNTEAGTPNAKDTAVMFKREELFGVLGVEPGREVPGMRRKPSTGPSGLRQTSFPPEESDRRAEFSRSPSVDSQFTTNTNTTRKKGRKGKGGDDDVRSTTGTSVRGGKAGAGEAGEKADEEEEADQDEGGEALDAVLEGQGEADEKQEKEHLRMLVDRLDPDQSDRYAKYRAVKLKKETVRKTPGAYHNPYGYQHLHPSYNPNPYSNIRIPGPPSATNSPAPGPGGPSIAPPHSPAANGSTPSPAPGAAPAPAATNGTAADPAGGQTPTPNASQDATVPASSSGTTSTAADGSPAAKDRTPIPADTPLLERLAERDRGPLTPDHLREALRRYKKDREGGAMGFLGLSLEGRERTAGRMGGRRLFR
ncbi:ankyrin [Neofusicoccum parvum]|uniref:Ankyrin n=1 Tax=Neofusicoccum parvum TaxID=310453 RepID=A0ACB5S5G4_9PEZI|nr:ankyrin [Neofusicoccum parvum]